MWCAREDLNLHGINLPLPPQGSASTNSATYATRLYFKIITFFSRESYCQEIYAEVVSLMNNYKQYLTQAEADTLLKSVDVNLS